MPAIRGLKFMCWINFKQQLSNLINTAWSKGEHYLPLRWRDHVVWTWTNACSQSLELRSQRSSHVFGVMAMTRRLAYFKFPRFLSQIWSGVPLHHESSKFFLNWDTKLKFLYICVILSLSWCHNNFQTRNYFFT